MKKLSLAVTIAVITFALQACTGNRGKDSKASADSANAVKDTASNPASSQMNITVGKADAKFATAAASGGQTEVELGKIAQEKGVNKRVKNFGAMMVSDHSKAGDELSALAKSKNITLPAVPGDQDQRTIDDLSKKTGADFDKAYVKEMIADHQKDIKLFQDASENCADPDLKAFATKTLPTLKAHLEAINAVSASMK